MITSESVQLKGRDTISVLFELSCVMKIKKLLMEKKCERFSGGKLIKSYLLSV